ncbi:DUF305 domain-containing protein [Micromonospora sp. NPDC049102]|uniref:DUF305 domain-containing protein n=1 Tax=Micromonospora sp. NPDC049102 TaxID=3364265 RepID=UPI003719C0CA
MPRATHLAWLVAASLLAACAGPSARPPTTASPVAADSAPAAADLSGIDVVFLSTMVGHSERTLQIVRLARDRLRDDALRTLAAAIEVTEADELSTMRGWLPTTGPGANAAGHDHAGHGDDTALDRLRAAPDTDVDRVLREVLADHQRAAADLARAQVGGGRDERVRDLARRIEQSRTAEVDLLSGYDAQVSEPPGGPRSS